MAFKMGEGSSEDGGMLRRGWNRVQKALDLGKGPITAKIVLSQGAVVARESIRNAIDKEMDERKEIYDTLLNERQTSVPALLEILRHVPAEARTDYAEAGRLLMDRRHAIEALGYIGINSDGAEKEHILSELKKLVREEFFCPERHVLGDGVDMTYVYMDGIAKHTWIPLSNSFNVRMMVKALVKMGENVNFCLGSPVPSAAVQAFCLEPSVLD